MRSCGRHEVGEVGAQLVVAVVVEAHWPGGDGVPVSGLLGELYAAAIGLEPMAHQ